MKKFNKEIKKRLNKIGFLYDERLVEMYNFIKVNNSQLLKYILDKLEKLDEPTGDWRPAEFLLGIYKCQEVIEKMMQEK